MAKPSATDPEAAEKWFRKRVPLSEAEQKKQEKQAEGWAFWVAAILGMRLTSDVLDSIRRSIRDGVSFERWREVFGQSLRTSWMQAKGRGPRINLAARNLAQAAYSGGRQRMLQRPLALALRPFMKYVALGPNPCPICAEINGTVLSSKDRYWKTHTPQLHHRCQCQLRALTAREARTEGITDKPPDLDAHTGFGDEPELGAISVSRIDLSNIDKRLAKLFRRKTKGGP